MKTLIFLFAFNLHAASVTPPIKEWNPHTGVSIDTPWDHKGGVAEGVFRMLPPEDVLKELEAMKYLNICKGNMSRCEQPLFTAMCIDGDLCKKKDKRGWQIFEFARFRREAVQDQPQRLMLTLSPTFNTVNQLVRDFSPDNYAPIYFYNRANGTMNFAPHPSQINYATFADQLSVSGGGRIALTNNEYILPKEGHVVGSDFVSVKNGVSYLKVKGPDGKKYGLKLELLE